MSPCMAKDKNYVLLDVAVCNVISQLWYNIHTGASKKIGCCHVW